MRKVRLLCSLLAFVLIINSNILIFAASSSSAIINNNMSLAQVAKVCIAYLNAYKNNFTYGSNVKVPPYSGTWGKPRTNQMDCSAYVSWVIREYALANKYTALANKFGRLDTSDFKKIGDSLAKGSNSGYLKYFQLVATKNDIPGGKIEKIKSQLKAGDIILYKENSGHHIEIIAETGKTNVYSCGSVSGWKNPGKQSYTRRTDVTYIFRIVGNTGNLEDTTTSYPSYKVNGVTISANTSITISSSKALNKKELEYMVGSWLKARLSDSQVKKLREYVLNDDGIDAILQVQKKYNISPLFIIAVATQEQKLGLSNSTVAITGKNLFSVTGKSSYGSVSVGGKTYKKYKTFKDSILDFGKLTYENCLKKNIKTIKAVGDACRAGNKTWTTNIIKISADIAKYYKKIG